MTNTLTVTNTLSMSLTLNMSSTLSMWGRPPGLRGSPRTRPAQAS
jgi:hypothetical protein